MKKLGILIAAAFLMVGMSAEAQCTKSKTASATSCCAKKSTAKVASVKAKGPCCIEDVKTAEYSSNKERRMAIKAFKKAEKNGEKFSSAKSCCSKEASAAIIREE